MGLFAFADGAVDTQLKALDYDVDGIIEDAQAIGFPLVDWLAKRLRGE